jgi:hypothetical protein
VQLAQHVVRDVREVRVSPCRKIGMSALRKRISVDEGAQLGDGLVCSSLVNSSSSIDRMKAEARLCCWANEDRSP